MTRTLVLLRHAKSSYPAGVPDHARPLAARGVRDAPVAGEVLLRLVGRPDLVLVSTAQRARETWDLAAPSWSPPPSVRLVDRIYDADAEAILEVVRDVSDEVSTLVVVGHVPGVSDLAVTLSGAGDADALSRLHEKYPTAGLACLRFDQSWSEVESGGGYLDSFDVPRGKVGQ